uniref:Structural maintenance of chromosomes protein 2 n=2 Tax=Lygus hesperus TaxID=30085 RepID=A0A0A9YLV4_LYGHE
MRVKSIVIDGFKSYAHRKELADLSPHFNAITGLNGSGKSNIFDAICFVMGITNLKKVRAEDPRELIFRAGTTGVHAARVTMEFLNDDPATAPPGYSCEDYPVITVGRQIKLGGKQQFFFNNTVSMQSKVKRFFESISLNVDNPHFMVLQGTVHKLIGMRSQDILALVEEAVGTKAFDHRRRTAEALIRGKERKMKEIDDNLETQIGPML